MKNIVIVGPAYPYRGGIASFDEMLARTFSGMGYSVKVKTFTLQYPEFLFPGKTQYSESEPPADIDIERCVNSVNPFNWIKVGRKIRKMKPDMVVMKYWTPFIGPCLGTIARIIRRNKHTRVIVQLDNIVPHEHHVTDRMLNRYFLKSADGFVYMSGEVKKDLDSFNTGKPALFSPHPMFTGFGQKVAKAEACEKLGLDPGVSYSLFFGIVRDYKGLDILLDAWKMLKDSGDTENRRLIVAGEFYYNKEKYVAQIGKLGLGDDIVMHDRFIKDEDVKYYFSVSDVLIQPYRSATQSGVTQIAYNFELPMIVTGVGGLPEIVPHDVAGYVTDTTPESVAEAYREFYRDGNAARIRGNMKEEKKRFSWSAMAGKIIEACNMVK